ncbi:DUF2934 domain-containing protein [Sphingomonas sp. 22176]|uniref:DUF2934 domain-containing protein n=1 Tax=Sphingomonas sp. 22176 TaxID=3453884 RepID=UPI003F843EBB
MSDDREHKVRERAHAIWQREGEPHGRHDEHWHQANREIDEEHGSAQNAVAQTPVAEDGAATEAAPKRRKRTAAETPATEKPAPKRRTTKKADPAA